MGWTVAQWQWQWSYPSCSYHVRTGCLAVLLGWTQSLGRATSLHQASGFCSRFLGQLGFWPLRPVVGVRAVEGSQLQGVECDLQLQCLPPCEWGSSGLAHLVCSQC